MKSQANKPRENQQSSSKKDADGKKGAARFENSRPEAVAQRKLKEGMADSTRNQDTAQLRKSMQEHTPSSALPLQRKSNETGLPDNLKSGVENLSGISMNDVKVHYNSDQPAQFKAHAYAQGSEIHVAPGQEKHLPHEAWHVVQQKQGRVKPTRQLKSKVAINDDAGLENEADVMGAKALQGGKSGAMAEKVPLQRMENQNVVQREVIPGSDGIVIPDSEYEYPDYEEGVPNYYEEYHYAIQDLKQLKRDSAKDTGSLFTLVNIEVWLRNKSETIKDLFEQFITGRGDNKTVEGEDFIKDLKDVFGYEEFAVLQEEFLTGGWGNLTFNTSGFNVAEFSNGSPNRQRIYTDMVELLTDSGWAQGRAQNKVKEVIESGKTEPFGKTTRPNEKFYKIMPAAQSFTHSSSPYYLSERTLKQVVKGDSLADYLGLPVLNYRPYYLVYEIHAIGPQKVYSSTIAATEQTLIGSGQVFKNRGGGVQTIILNNFDNTRWTKDPVAKYILDPDETEVESLRRLEE